MDHLTLLAYAEDELNRVIAGLDETEMDVVTNCPPWTVRRLASHALKNQLFWAGSVTGQNLMALDESMAAVPYGGDLAPVAAEVTALALRLWHSDGVMAANHDTPFGVLPGAVVLDFAVIDAAAHAWDLSASLRRAIEFPAESVPAMTDVVTLTCNRQAIELGLIKPPTVSPVDATDTERLMAAAGRTITRG
ncbi:MAG TPA: maleylpyruvate isomerase N-terminal domain-containing protein [Oryzihumus sp.]|nr:maleylpyruvate isomerase N-terminal domain-containing protein [Oryzihumus sp.]